MFDHVKVDETMTSLKAAAGLFPANVSSRIHKAALVSFETFYRNTENNSVNVRQAIDFWYSHLCNSESLAAQTRKKYYNVLLQISIKAVEAGTLRDIEIEVSRALPVFPKPSVRCELEPWLAYERFAQWYHQVGDGHGPLSPNHFRLFKIWLIDKKPSTAERTYSRLRSFWVSHLLTWFSPPITIPPFEDKGKLRYGLAIKDWPVQVRDEFSLYASKVSYDGLAALEDDYKAVSAGTLDQYRARIGRLIGYLLMFHPDRLHSASLKELLSNRLLIEDYLDWHIENCSGGNEREFHAEFLWLCAQILTVLGGEAGKVAELKSMGSSIRPVRAVAFHQRVAPDFDKIAYAVERALADAEANYLNWKALGSPVEIAGSVAAQYCEILIFALLSWRPMRSRNYRELCLEKNLRPTVDGWKICFDATETKTRTEIELDWPIPLIPYLERYLHDLRPVLNLSSKAELFLRADGTAYTKYALWDVTVALGNQYLDTPSNPHAFRSYMVTGYLLANPGDIDTCKALLGHRYVRTTLRHYAFVQSRVASRTVWRFVEETCPHALKAAAWRPAAA